MKISNTFNDHTLIIDEIESSINFYNWHFILSYLPKGSYLVGGYIRDIILKRITEKVDIDIANQVSSTIEGDLRSRDYSINSIAYLFDKKSLFDPFNGSTKHFLSNKKAIEFIEKSLKLKSPSIVDEN